MFDGDSEMPYRDITSFERALLDRILDFRSRERNTPTVRVERYLVKEIDGEGSLKFAHEGTPGQFEQKLFPVEAQAQDADGIWIHALLFVTDNVVDELQIYKDDSSPILRMPNPQEWEVFELPFDSEDSAD